MEYAIDDKNSISVGGNMNAGFRNEYNLKTNTNRDSNNTLKDQWNQSFHKTTKAFHMMSMPHLKKNLVQTNTLSSSISPEITIQMISIQTWRRIIKQ